MGEDNPKHLPRLRLKGSTYFVTWRIIENSPELAPSERDTVQSALLHFHEDRYVLVGYVVMNDHVHVVVRPLAENELGKILHSWKSFTAHEIQKRRGRSGSLWQKASYDRILRTESDLREKLQYILDNPAKRWPGTADYPWTAVFQQHM